jgi:hypothetical protein
MHRSCAKMRPRHARKRTTLARDAAEELPAAEKDCALYIFALCLAAICCDLLPFLRLMDMYLLRLPAKAAKLLLLFVSFVSIVSIVSAKLLS